VVVTFEEILTQAIAMLQRLGRVSYARYREPPWQRLIGSAGTVLAKGRDQGEAIEQVVATIWTVIEQHCL
jgi:hypothetical protein